MSIDEAPAVLTRALVAFAGARTVPRIRERATKQDTMPVLPASRHAPIAAGSSAIST
jgi:hypothetical protein